MPHKKDTKVSQESVETSIVEESTNGSETPKELSDIERLTAMVEAQAKQIDILTKSADKTQLARHTPKDTIGRSIRVATIEGKLIESWKTLSNDVRFDKYGEKANQIGEYTLEDGSKVEYKIGQGDELYESVWVDVNLDKCKFKFDEKGNRREIEEFSFIWKGKEKKLSSTFINP